MAVNGQPQETQPPADVAGSVLCTLGIGQSPKTVVWTRNKATLYRYVNPNVRYATPILIIYALINKPYILDLHPDTSLIAWLVEEGFDVFLLDWGTPGLEDRRVSYDDLVYDYIDRAVKHALRTSNARNVTLLGYCMGGTMAAMYAATHPDAGVRNLALLAAPVDFSHPTLLAHWLNPRYFDTEKLVAAYGNIPAEIIGLGSKMLNPVANFIGTYADLWDRRDDPQSVAAWQRINHWVNDGVPFPGAAFRQWVNDFYRANRLITNTLYLRGQSVSLHNITVPTLVIAAENDHITPPQQALPLLSAIRSTDKQAKIFPAGHVGLIVGRKARHELWPYLAEWLQNHSSW